MSVRVISAIIQLSVFVKVIQSRCSGYNSPMSTTSGSGVISSPRYPRTYYTNENCRWNLNFHFDHAHYLVLFDVKEMQMSYQSIFATTKTCTGHLSVYGDNIDCRNEKPFCKAYYFSRSKLCDKLAKQSYSNCNLIKRSTLQGANAKFTSEYFLYKRIKQKGFQIKYQFIDCREGRPTTTTNAASDEPTTASNTPTTTTTPTTTITSTKTTTTSTTTPAPTPTTTITSTKTTTSTTTTTTTAEPTTTNRPPQSPTTTPTLVTTTIKPEASTTTTSDSRPTTTIATTKPASSSEPMNGLRNTGQLHEISLNKEKRIQTSTTSVTSCGESGCAAAMAETTKYTLWIVPPIGAILLIIAVILLIRTIRRKRTKESREAAYLVGFENRTYHSKATGKCDHHDESSAF